MVGESITEKVNQGGKKRCQKSGKGIIADIGGKINTESRNSKCTDPKEGACLTCSTNQQGGHWVQLGKSE